MFSAKIQDGRQKIEKIEKIFIQQEASSTTLWVKNSIEIALSLTVFEILAFVIFR